MPRFRDTKASASKNILPDSLFEQHAKDYSKRMGSQNFAKRIAIEEKINPSAPFSFNKLGKWIVHNTAFAIISAYFIANRKFRESINNCWQTSIEHNMVKSSVKTPIRILQLSDLHLDTNLSQAKTWKKELKDLKYDLTVITGDFLNAFQLPEKETYHTLKELIQSIESPVFAILGNHDCLFMTHFLEKFGVRVLLNESTSINLKGLKILITGLDDPHYFQTDDLPLALHNIMFENYDLKIALTHAPKKLDKIAEHPFNICLCGHTHGGQLCTSGGTPILKNGRYIPETVSGNWKYKNLNGYTSRGTGTGHLSFRMNCSPEITIHSLI